MVLETGTEASPDRSWERRHPGTPEWWLFDFWAPDGSLGGFVGMVFAERAWFWSGLVGHRRPYVLVRDLDVDLPRSEASWGVRAQGLWADVNCETPFEHWSVRLEAFAVSMDHPAEALAGERGHRVGLGLDLEWEAACAVVGGPGHYEQASTVHGEVLVGSGGEVEAIAVDGHGWRRHGWGSLGWLAPSHSWLGGRLDDATPHRSDDMGGYSVAVHHRAPLRVETGARRLVLERALCRFDAPDGRPGVGWAEWLSDAG